MNLLDFTTLHLTRRLCKVHYSLQMAVKCSYTKSLKTLLCVLISDLGGVNNHKSQMTELTKYSMD